MLKFITTNNELATKKLIMQISKSRQTKSFMIFYMSQFDETWNKIAGRYENISRVSDPFYLQLKFRKKIKHSS